MARRFVLALSLTLAFLAPLALGLEAVRGPPTPPAAAPAQTVRAVFVGNNWDGTADILRFDPVAESFTRLAHVNIIPDIDQRMLEIYTNPVRLGYFLAIREAIGEGHDQFVDDMYSTNDGKTLIVSRPSLADVVGLDLASGAVAWRFVMDGQRSDHMGLSPDGLRVAVSDSTANVVHILDTATGREVGRFASGDTPHENTYSKDGSRLFHASIGRVYVPLEDPPFGAAKGSRVFEVVDTSNNAILKQWDMGAKLADAGYPNMSSAVRPMTLSPDERFLYFQVSFFHGFAEYDFAQEKVLRLAQLPERFPDMPKEEYVLNSGHHGIAMDKAGTSLCVAGTMDDYAAFVSRSDFSDYTLLPKEQGARPYWVTASDDGEHCFISWSGLDSVSALSYHTRGEVASIAVGDHPQRIRTGPVLTSLFQP